MNKVRQTNKRQGEAKNTDCHNVQKAMKKYYKRNKMSMLKAVQDIKR